MMGDMPQCATCKEGSNSKIRCLICTQEKGLLVKILQGDPGSTTPEPCPLYVHYYCGLSHLKLIDILSYNPLTFLLSPKLLKMIEESNLIVSQRIHSQFRVLE